MGKAHINGGFWPSSWENLNMCLFRIAKAGQNTLLKVSEDPQSRAQSEPRLEMVSGWWFQIASGDYQYGFNMVG